MIYDIITYNGEKELFEIRYNILKDFVDEFRIVEFDKTFSGKEKPFYGLQLDKSIYPKAKFYWLGESEWSKYKDLARSSPNTEYGKGAEHWIREFCQKESIKDCLTDLNDEDIVFIGDCDEIWNPTVLGRHLIGTRGIINLSPVWKLKLKVYSYYLNNKSNEEFWGTMMTKYHKIKDRCLNHLRSVDLLTQMSVEDDITKEHHIRTTEYYGWHFTSMGGVAGVAKKLIDSYTSETYANDTIMRNLRENVLNSRDFLGREFTYKVDESEWPQYLKDNRDKYKHLLKS